MSMKVFNEDIDFELSIDNGTIVKYFPKELRHVTTRLGYKIEVKNEYGEWINEIFWPDDNGSITIIRPHILLTGNQDFDDVISMLLNHLLKNYLGGTINNYLNSLAPIASKISDGKSIIESMEHGLNSSVLAQDLTAIKKLSEWLIISEIESYPYDFHHELMKLSFGENRNQYSALFTFNSELGPFVSEEMSIIQSAISNPHIHVENRVILALFVFFGLRPIQVSLLKQSDIVINEDSALNYIKIPRVKQNQQERRTQFTKRLLSSELSELLVELISIHNRVYSNLELVDPPLIMRRITGFHGTEHPYREQRESDYGYKSKNSQVNKPLSFQKYQEIYIDNNKDEEGHHLSSNGIRFRLQEIERYLPNSPRTNRQFNLFPYRFRYTLGTNAVMEGKTEAEVMDLLDHSSPGSVKHYFRYTHEMYEILNEATNKRVEQQHFVAAWTREGDQTGNIYGQEIVEIKYFTSIGKCHKGSFCSFEPAVACYNCDKFCPSKDAKAHENALETLNDRLEELKATSTGAVLHQLDGAIAGCKAAIAYSEGKDIEFLEFNTEDRGLDDE